MRWSVVVFLAACTSFDPIERDVCGNGLVETGEDCDSDDPSCVRCSIACAATADCPDASYACGVDGLCHAAGGALAQPVTSPGAFGASELAITDIDHDGIGDVMGVSRTSIVVRHGDAAAQLGAEESALTPAQTGPVAFGDLDGDGSLDLTLTTLDGLVSYTAPYGELAPLAVQSAILDGRTNQPLDIRSMFHIADTVFAGFIKDPITSNLFVFAIDFENPGGDQAMVFAAPCATRGAIASSDFDPAKVETYMVNHDGDGQLDTLLAMSTGATNKLCVLAFHRAAPGLGAFPAITIADVTPPNLAPAHVPLFADLDTDTDRCPGLVNRDGGPAQLTWYDGAMGSAGCTLVTTAAALAPIPSAAPGIDVVGRVALDPQVALVAADALVTSDGVWVYLPQGVPIVAPNLRYVDVYRTTRRIAFVVSGRIDGDDHSDAIVVPEDGDDLDLLYRVPGKAGFQLLRLDTASQVTTVTLGDYDGNGLTDIAFTEQQEDHERMMIAYGTPDRPLAPVSVGAFPGIVSVTRVQMPDSVDYLGLDADLFVIGPPLPGKTFPRMTILHGSPQRTMLSYFDPRQDAQKTDRFFRGSVIGNFATNQTTTVFSDVLAFAPSSTQTTVRAWRVPGTSDGLDGTETPGVDVSGMADCSTTTSGMLCLDDARYLAFPAAADKDVVIGVDRGRRAVTIDPWSSAMTASPSTALAAAIPAGTVPRSLHHADVDGDGNVDLIATFAPIADGAGAVVVCNMAAGIPQQCTDLVPAIRAASPDIQQCVDAAPARIAYRTKTADVVVACRGDGMALFRVRGQTIDRLATTGAPITAIRAGDVTGDGVDDLIVVEGDAVKSLVVYPQCTSRDACGGGS